LKSEKIRFADQIPPFDITLIGVNDEGAVSRCAFYGVHVTQETGGWSMMDLNNAAGFSFVCMDCEPWRPLNFPGSR
jgi:hypothetical protein